MNKYYLIIPFLGLIKNYIKYKKLSILIFFRTPFINLLIEKILFYKNYQNRVLLSIICERIFFFIFKITRSYINNDYIIKKNKYIKKYGLNYDKDIFDNLRNHFKNKLIQNKKYKTSISFDESKNVIVSLGNSGPT